MITMDNKTVWMKGTAKELNERENPSTPVSTAYDAWAADPTPDNSATLLKTLKPTVESALTSFAGESKNSLRTKANLMALDAVKLYDPGKNTKLQSHVFNHLKGLNRIKAKRTHMVHIPENALLELNRLRKEQDAYTAEHGREPTVSQLADATGLSIKRIEKLRTTHTSQTPVSAALTEKGDSLFTKASDPQKIWADYVYYDLDDPDKKIFEWSTGYGGTPKISKMEMAKRLGISPAAVSRRVSKIIHMLEVGYDV